jgi:O-acetylhomoserine (thiol)-lyase
MDDSQLLLSGIEPGTVRLSIGTEHVDHLIEDVADALACV